MRVEMSVRPLDISHRGLEIGYVVGLHGLRAAWRSSLEDGWHEGHIYVDSVDEIPRLARECIDWNYLKHVAEVEKGSALTLDEIMRLGPYKKPS